MSREIGQSRWHAWWINGGLTVLALVSLAPLLWMLSVSFMPTGEAAHFPPPLLPSSVTTGQKAAEALAGRIWHQ